MAETAFEPTYAAEHLAEPEYRYPVIVTVHHDHIVWVEGESLRDALLNLMNDGAWYEHLNNNETLVSTWEEMREPGRYDHVYDGGDSGPSLACDAHVESHNYVLSVAKRTAEKAACKGAAHPELRVYDGTKPEAFCPTCGYLKLGDLVTDLRGSATCP